MLLLAERHPATPALSEIAPDIDPVRLDLSHYPQRYGFATRRSDVQNGRLSDLALARLYEDARIQLIRHVLGSTQVFSTDNWKAVARFLRLIHLRPCLYPEPVTVGIGIDRLGNSSYTYAMGLFQNGQCCGLNNAVGVTLADDRRGPAPLPAHIRMAFSRCLLGGGQ